MSEQSKYYVKIIAKDKPIRISKQTQDSLKGVVGGKMMAKMKREAVDCPVLQKEVPFLECFICADFLRRFKGEVHCTGLPL